MTGVLGVRVNWHFRPERVSYFGFNVILHNLILTRVLVSAERSTKLVPDSRVAEVRICYELGALLAPVEIDVDGKREKLTVIPDEWIVFERMREGKREAGFPVLLKIDRGTMFMERFKRHVLSRVEFVESGAYKRVFGTRAVVVALR